MKTASTAFKNALKLEVAGLVRLWYMKTRDNVEYYFTDSDVDVTETAKKYISTEGFIASATVQEIGKGQQGLSITFALSETGISKKKINQGDFDSAEVSIYAYNQLAPAAGTFLLMKGRVNTTDVDDIGNATFDIIGLVDSGQSSINMEQYSLTCRADFGDERCKYNYLSTAQAFTVTAISGKQSFTANITQPSHTFDLGFVEFTSGNNDGILVEVMYNEAGKVVLYLPFPAELAIGDTGTIYKGCAKTVAACSAYGNIYNFRGEPFDPLATVIVEETPEAVEIPSVVVPTTTKVDSPRPVSSFFLPMNISG